MYNNVFSILATLQEVLEGERKGGAKLFGSARIIYLPGRSSHHVETFVGEARPHSSLLLFTTFWPDPDHITCLLCVYTDIADIGEATPRTL